MTQSELNEPSQAHKGKKDQPSSVSPPFCLSAPPPPPSAPLPLLSADSAVCNGDESDIFLSVFTQLTLSAEQHFWLMETNLQEQQRNNNRLDYQINSRAELLPWASIPGKHS